MAIMQHRESNQVKWLGVKPAHNGTQITKSNTQTGAGTKTIYTVPADNTLFITYATLASRESANVAGDANISTTPIGEAGATRLIRHFYDLAGHQVSTATFNPSVEVAAGETVDVISSHANIDGSATIHGWIEEM